MALLAAPFIHAPDATATVCSGSSGSQRVALLELYTSEGCDSCPPADVWVSALPSKNLKSDRLLALAFHVDYWNYIGWVDPFGQARFSARQRAQSQRRGAKTVYTPQLLLNGADYRRGASFDDIDARVNAINRMKPSADISITLEYGADAAKASVLAAATAGGHSGAELYLALFENQLASAVKSGENKGRTLKHDFVVRELAGPLAFDHAGTVRHQQTFRLDARWKRADLRLAAFVQHAQTGDVWQALAVACP